MHLFHSCSPQLPQAQPAQVLCFTLYLIVPFSKFLFSSSSVCFLLDSHISLPFHLPPISFLLPLFSLVYHSFLVIRMN